MGKYDNWYAIFQHPIAGRLVQYKAPPHSVVLFSPKGEKFTAIYHLEWRDMDAEIAYYKLATILKESFPKN